MRESMIGKSSYSGILPWMWVSQAVAAEKHKGGAEYAGVR